MNNYAPLSSNKLDLYGLTRQDLEDIHYMNKKKSQNNTYVMIMHVVECLCMYMHTNIMVLEWYTYLTIFTYENKYKCKERAK